MNSNEAFDILAKGLVDADVFVETATGADLRGILPREVVEKFDDTLSAESAGLPAKEPDMPDGDITADETGDEALSAEQVEELLSYVEELETELDSLRPAEAEDVLVSKALSELPDEVAAIVKADRVRLQKAEAELNAQREDTANAQFIAKAASLDSVIEDANEFGPMLRRLNDYDPDLAEAVTDALSIAHERVEKSVLLAELGTAGTGVVTNAQEEVVALAKRLVEDDPKLNLDEAEATIWQNRPDLYDEYQKERQVALRNA